jgi:rare lipoprotein A
MKKLILILLLPTITACQTTAKSSDLNNLTVASWYQSGKRTASGQRFDPNGHTVAHRTLPFGTKLQLTNPENGKSIIATVNDRGPFIRGTGLDVSRGIAQYLNFIKKGKTKLNMRVLD